MNQPVVRLHEEPSDYVVDMIDRELTALLAERDEIATRLSPIESRIALLLKAKDALAGKTNIRRCGEIRTSTKSGFILSIMKDAGRPLRASEAAELARSKGFVQNAPNQVACLLRNLKGKGALRSPKRGAYEMAE